MQKLTLILIFSLCSSFLYAQKNLESRFESADSYLENGFFELGRNLLIEIKKDLKADSYSYSQCVDKIAQSYLLQWKEVMQSPLAEKRRSFLEGFLAHIEAESQYLSPSIRNDRKYYIYEALLGEALNAGEGEKANVYKNKLYYGFSNGRLPDRLKEMFSLGKYNNGSVSIWGYEHFEGVSSRKDKGSFSKMIFSVYPANSPGMEEKELMQFHLKTINWIDDKLGKYVLVQKPGASQAGPVVTLWDLSFDDPIDYLELREILMTLAMSGDSRGK